MLFQQLPLLWKPQGNVEIIDLGHHIFLFKFDLQLDLDRIMYGGPWLLFG